MSDPRRDGSKNYVKGKLVELQGLTSELSDACLKHNEQMNYFRDELGTFSDAPMNQKKGIFQSIEAACSVTFLPLCQRIHNLISQCRQIGGDLKTAVQNHLVQKDKEKYRNLLLKQDKIVAEFMSQEPKIYDAEQYLQRMVSDLKQSVPAS
jgi:hypothetical protein